MSILTAMLPSGDPRESSDSRGTKTITARDRRFAHRSKNPSYITGGIKGQ